MNFDPDNITPGPYDVPTLIDDVDPVHPIPLELEEDISFSDLNSHSASAPVTGISFEGSGSFGDVLDHSPGPGATHEWQELSGGQDIENDLPELGFFGESFDADVEEILRADEQPQPWMLGLPSPSSSKSSSSLGSGGDMSVKLKEPVFAPDSPEMLVSMFSKLTCGILSIKDGPTENPWRTMLLPMARDVPALHHAILSMTAFHASRHDPRFRIAGLRHSQKSLHYLGNRLGVMRKDAALATTLVLAFSESWDQETSTGIRHLRAARRLITQPLIDHQNAADWDEIERLKFLRNTWVYMDVIARITASDGDDLEDLDSLFIPIYGPDGLVHGLDPLMGCAATFFPLLGRVANLVREIRKSTRISPRVVSRAAALRVEILKWRPPVLFQQPEDESIEIAHSLKTAEAYRWATLLFLYQAVPLIATENLADLAEKVLYDLVLVPTSSRLVIVHIFPLLVAGCELSYEDNRLLVEERWALMMQRMEIGNLDRCLDVVHEVWRRRDEIVRPIQEGDEQVLISDDDMEHVSDLGIRRRTLSTPTSYPTIIRPDQLKRSPTDHVADINPEMTVRGRCHWLTVMRDWNWASESCAF